MVPFIHSTFTEHPCGRQCAESQEYNSKHVYLLDNNGDKYNEETSKVWMKRGQHTKLTSSGNAYVAALQPQRRK